MMYGVENTHSKQVSVGSETRRQIGERRSMRISATRSGGYWEREELGRLWLQLRLP